MVDNGMQRFGFVLSNSRDPGRIDEFERWYTDIHIPDMLETEGYVRGTRYRLAAGLRDASPEILVLYELDSPDDYRTLNQKMMENMARKQAAGRTSDLMESVTAGFFEQVSETPVWSARGAGSSGVLARPPQALLLELAACTDAARIDEVDAWYASAHDPALLRAPAVLNVTRYRWPRPRDGRVQIMSLCGLDDARQQDLEGAMHEVLASADAGGARPDCLEPVIRGVYSLRDDLTSGGA